MRYASTVIMHKYVFLKQLGVVSWSGDSWTLEGRSLVFSWKGSAFYYDSTRSAIERCSFDFQNDDRLRRVVVFVAIDLTSPGIYIFFT